MIQESAKRYAEQAVTRLDRAFDELCGIQDIPIFILTPAYDEGIQAVIKKKRAAGLQLNVHGIFCNTTEFTDYDHKFFKKVGYRHSGSQSPRSELQRLTSPVNFRNYYSPDKENVIYIGGTKYEEPCVQEVGRFVVAPMAGDEFKQHMSSTYGKKVRTPARGELVKAIVMD